MKESYVNRSLDGSLDGSLEDIINSICKANEKLIGENDTPSKELIRRNKNFLETNGSIDLSFRPMFDYYDTETKTNALTAEINSVGSIILYLSSKFDLNQIEALAKNLTQKLKADQTIEQLTETINEELAAKLALQLAEELAANLTTDLTAAQKLSDEELEVKITQLLTAKLIAEVPAELTATRTSYKAK
jgi:hypothetical protein